MVCVTLYVNTHLCNLFYVLVAHDHGNLWVYSLSFSPHLVMKRLTGSALLLFVSISILWHNFVCFVLVHVLSGVFCVIILH